MVGLHAQPSQSGRGHVLLRQVVASRACSVHSVLHIAVRAWPLGRPDPLQTLASKTGTAWRRLQSVTPVAGEMLATSQPALWIQSSKRSLPGSAAPAAVTARDVHARCRPSAANDVFHRCTRCDDHAAIWHTTSNWATTRRDEHANWGSTSRRWVPSVHRHPIQCGVWVRACHMQDLSQRAMGAWVLAVSNVSRSHSACFSFIFISTVTACHFSRFENNSTRPKRYRLVVDSLPKCDRRERRGPRPLHITWPCWQLKITNQKCITLE